MPASHGWAIMTRKRFIAGGVVVVALAAMWLVVTSLTRDHYRFDSESFESIDEIGRSAEDVVVGTVVGVQGRFVDRGGDPEFDEYGDPIPGIPMIVYEVRVDSPLKGSSGTGTLLPVAMVDLGKVTAEGISDIDTNRPVVLFLRHRTTETAPDIRSVADELWVIVGGDNGILDVRDDTAIPRSPALARLSADSAEQDSFAISDLLAALAG
jgi:hypothetical protein